ncbi:hypothetical protein Catovirus_2_216 [Catovirus CTV1]|uniref:Uncharacterized protein n=1 Tax=Catovirus CTV1 TaxID=1977631 RepID=A0A1V0SC21_9VIRU|nr:hypothetical protein Catovirus_2_216 [Catovirus CTV1]
MNDSKLNLISKLLLPEHNGFTFIVYPVQSKNDTNFGRYDVSFDKYNKLLSFMNKNKINCKKYVQTLYQHNDMELKCLENTENPLEPCIQYTSKKYIYQTIEENMFINIVDINNIQPEKFPILNKYNNEVKQQVCEYKLKQSKLYLMNENSTYYTYFTFFYNGKNNLIEEDLQFINKVLKNIL